MGRIRAVLEGTCAGFAARKAGPDDLAALRARLQAMVVATKRGNTEALAAANDSFHTALHAIAGNAFLTRSLQALRAYFHIGSSKVLPDAEQRRTALAEHTAIVEAIAAGDADQAEALMRAHTLRSLAVAFPQHAFGALAPMP
jgi:DNA-binding GntR family transcriptional regulator